MTNSIYGHHQIGNRLSPQDGEAEVDGGRDGDSRGLRTMEHPRLAAEGLSSRDGKASGQCFQANQELKTKKDFAPFAPLPLCGKRASRWQEQDAGNAVVDSVGYLYDGYSKLAAEGLRSRDRKASGQCFQTNQELKTKKGFAPFAPLPLCGKWASRWQEQDAGNAVVDSVACFYAWRSMQSAGGVGGLLMVLDGLSTSEYNQSSRDPADDDYFPLTGYKKASPTTPATQLDAIYYYDAFGQEVRSSGPAADVVPYHFSTKFTDATGLVFYGYRWYNAAKGRWLSRDPIGEKGGRNLYGMVGNNVENQVEILGLMGSPMPGVGIEPGPGPQNNHYPTPGIFWGWFLNPFAQHTIRRAEWAMKGGGCCKL